MEALNNSKRGVWSTTELGREMTATDIPRRHAAYLAQMREARRQRKAAEADQGGAQPMRTTLD
jgi:hypothetical protein